MAVITRELKTRSKRVGGLLEASGDVAIIRGLWMLFGDFCEAQVNTDARILRRRSWTQTSIYQRAA
jgi:hypothetical protein